MPADCLIRDARIVDGTGAPWFSADVLLRDGRIAEIGKSISAVVYGSWMRGAFIWRPALSMRIAMTI